MVSLSLRAGVRSFIKRVFHHQKSLGRGRNLSLCRETILPWKVSLQNLDRELSKANSDMTGHGKIRISIATMTCDRIWKVFILILISKIKLTKLSIFGSHPRGSETRICTPLRVRCGRTCALRFSGFGNPISFIGPQWACLRASTPWFLTHTTHHERDSIYKH